MYLQTRLGYSMMTLSTSISCSDQQTSVSSSVARRRNAKKTETKQNPRGKFLDKGQKWDTNPQPQGRLQHNQNTLNYSAMRHLRMIECMCV